MDQKEKHFDHIWTSFEIKKMCVKKCVKFVFIGCWLSSILAWSPGVWLGVGLLA